MGSCILCDESEATEICGVCNNDLCETCNEEHQHCIVCGGSGTHEWNVKRNSLGETDYLHGEFTGETAEENCNRCDQTGLRI